PTIVGLSEGMQGSSLNAGNFGQARRLFAEGTLSTLWRNAAASMSTLVPPPPGSELACDTRDVPFLREDQKDAAEIQQVKAQTIRSFIDAGFVPDSVVAAVDADDRSLLVHSGLYSVQLQPLGMEQPTSTDATTRPPLNGSPLPARIRYRSGQWRQTRTICPRRNSSPARRRWMTWRSGPGV